MADPDAGVNEDTRIEALRLRGQLVRAVNGNPVTVEDAWAIIHAWDDRLGLRGSAAPAPTDTPEEKVLNAVSEMFPGFDFGGCYDLDDLLNHAAGQLDNERTERAAAPTDTGERIVRDTDEKPSDSMPQVGFKDFREQAEWWQQTCEYWRARTNDLLARLAAASSDASGYVGDGTRPTHVARTGRTGRSHAVRRLP